MRPGQIAGLKEVGPEGVAVVRGEAGGNTHLLIPDPGSKVSFARKTGTTLGVAVIEGTAYLDHNQHGDMGIGSGAYEFVGQRQQMDEVRRVAD
jgi:hypothetical protein